MPEKINIKIGEIFGRLGVIDEGRSSDGGLRWICVCECGNIRIVRPDRLKSGRVKSCGCLRIHSFIERNTTHDKTNHPLYGIWVNIKQRCFNPNNDRYSRYGGRGISVCQRWMNFGNFYNDNIASYKKGLQIDRKDNDGDYEPSNCRWVSLKSQARNKSTNHRITYCGLTLTIAEWAEFSGTSAGNINYRIRAGWPIRDCIFKLPQKTARL